ncbi:MAG: DUF3299 domain-containing protein [Verrucomicrobia bacterium]|nr:DUF3299 domain-containing protein [Verrucomicrobiota bacterium]
MSNPMWNLSAELRAAFCASLAACLLAGCSASSRSSEDNAPADIRGEPINPSKPESKPSVADSSGSASTNSTQSELQRSEQVQTAAGPNLAQPQDSQAPNSTTEEFVPVAFDKLASFNFVIPDDRPSTNQVATPSKSEEQIPAGVKALDQTKVALKGFMLPLRVESGLVTEMLIMRDQSMCCYGTVPKINEWVSVKMTNKGVKPIMDQPVTVFGKLRVGEMRENGYLVGIYAMDGEKMAVPADL